MFRLLSIDKPMEIGKPSGGLSCALQSERTSGRRNLRMNCVASLRPNRFLDRETEHYGSNLVRKAGLPSTSVECQLLQLSTVQGLSPPRRVRMLSLVLPFFASFYTKDSCFCSLDCGCRDVLANVKPWRALAITLLTTR